MPIPPVRNGTTQPSTISACRMRRSAHTLITALLLPVRNGPVPRLVLIRKRASRWRRDMDDKRLQFGNEGEELVPGVTQNLSSMNHSKGDAHDLSGHLDNDTDER